MQRDSPGMLAQPNHYHFGESALNRSVEVGMRLDTIDHDHAISSMSSTINIDRETTGQPTQFINIKRGDDRRTCARFGYAKTGQDGKLPLRCGSAMASHSRNNKGVCSRAA